MIDKSYFGGPWVVSRLDGKEWEAVTSASRTGRRGGKAVTAMTGEETETGDGRCTLCAASERVRSKVHVSAVGLSVSNILFTLCSAVDRPEGGPSADRGMFKRVIEEGRGGVWHASTM